MTKPQPSFSLAQLMASPAGRMFVEQSAIDSSTSLADFCEKVIHDIFCMMEENPQHHQNKSEDEITNYIVDILKAKCVRAEHDTMHGGHADIIIRHDQYKWLAEAKIFENGFYSWLIKGLLQLTTRYMAGRDQRGALLIYTYKANIKKIMSRWRELLSSYKRITSVTDCAYCPLSFYTTLENRRSGLEVRVRHTILGLHYRPEA